MSTGNAIGVALSSLYGITLAILLLTHRRQAFLVVATGGAALLGLYWSFGR